MSYARSPGAVPSGPSPPSMAISRPPAPTIFIGNIPYDLSEAQLVEIFQEVGPVKSLRLVSDRESGKAKGYGFCEYYDVSTAEGAVRNLNGHEVHGRQLRVDFADEHIARGPREKAEATAVVHQPPPPPPSAEAVGLSSIKLAACQMSFLLGGSGAVLTDPAPLGGSNEKVYEVLARMSKIELFEVLSAVKSLVQTNFNQARQLLIQNPQLARSLFQIEVLLGLVDAPGLPTSAKQSIQEQQTSMSQRPFVKEEPVDLNGQNTGLMNIDQQHMEGDGMEGVTYRSTGAVPSEMRGMDVSSLDGGSREQAQPMHQLTMNGGAGGEMGLASVAGTGVIAQDTHPQLRGAPQMQAPPPPMQVVPHMQIPQQTVMQPRMNVPGGNMPSPQMLPGQMGLPDTQQNPSPQPYSENAQKIGDQVFGNLLAGTGGGGQTQLMQSMNPGVASGGFMTDSLVGDMTGQSMGTQSGQVVGGGLGGVQNLGMLGGMGGGGMQMSAGVGGLGGQTADVGAVQSGINPVSGVGMSLEQGDGAQQAGLDLGKKALLDQIMSLTPTQIDLLPSEQRSQVLALQQQLRFQM
ncbi:hypothetical protein BSKO_01628 [Bryopsis sp. KO-2023]|nr:hypothetical protein BSKO_01628 [Bryopsis sp. KO-2023]